MLPYVRSIRYGGALEANILESVINEIDEFYCILHLRQQIAHFIPLSFNFHPSFKLRLLRSASSVHVHATD